jgi:tRNA(Ile)-lysidine synthase TilS/MesJ
VKADPTALFDRRNEGGGTSRRENYCIKPLIRIWEQQLSLRLFLLDVGQIFPLESDAPSKSAVRVWLKAELELVADKRSAGFGPLLELVLALSRYQYFGGEIHAIVTMRREQPLEVLAASDVPGRLHERTVCKLAEKKNCIKKI